MPANDSLESPEDSYEADITPYLGADRYVHCTIFNIHGDVSAVSKRISKAKILRQFGLFARDLRKIDNTAIDVVPAIVVRENCIIVNMLHIKALIKENMLMIFDVKKPDAARKLSLFIYDLETKLKAPPPQGAAGDSDSWQQAFEHKVLESILINVVSVIEAEMQEFEAEFSEILSDLEDQLNRNKLRELLVKSKVLSGFYQRVLLIRNVFDEILDDDDALNLIYLTENAKLREKGEGKTVVDHGEVEMMLETYYKQCDEVVQKALSLLANIRSTEEIVNIILDANRNSLMLFELKISIYTLGFSVAAFVAALYGMNLNISIEEWDFGFPLVVTGSVALALIITRLNLKRLRTVQRRTVMKSGNRQQHVGSRNAPFAAPARASKWQSLWSWMPRRKYRIENKELNQMISRQLQNMTAKFEDQSYIDSRAHFLQSSKKVPAVVGSADDQGKQEGKKDGKDGKDGNRDVNKDVNKDGKKSDELIAKSKQIKWRNERPVPGERAHEALRREKWLLMKWKVLHSLRRKMWYRRMQQAGQLDKKQRQRMWRWLTRGHWK